jgi:hypothetical protein
MGRKLKLLPHWCQIAGYTYILGLLLCFAYALVDMTGIFPEDCRIINGINIFHKHALANWNFVGALNFIMIFLAIFSKEKVEDEMTTAIRINTLLYLVFFIFGLHILMYLPSGKVRELIINIRGFFMEDFGILILTYAILFKVMIWINMWRMRNEE